MSDYALLASEADRLRSLVEQLTLSRYSSKGYYPKILLALFLHRYRRFSFLLFIVELKDKYDFDIQFFIL
jgi:hypothetical protein